MELGWFRVDLALISDQQFVKSVPMIGYVTISKVFLASLTWTPQMFIVNSVGLVRCRWQGLGCFQRMRIDWPSQCLDVP